MISGDPTYDWIFTLALACTPFVALATRFVHAPYGRFGTAGLGPALDPRLGWILMELPATLVFAWFAATPTTLDEPVRLLFVAIWTIHYANRGVLFPLRLRVRVGAGFGWLVVVFGWLTTATHGYLNGAWIGGLGVHLTSDWLADPRFTVGIALYLTGFTVNVLADATLRDLRNERRGGYRIPHGGLYRWVSCPNYLGELLAWAGFTLATGSPGGVFIFAISAANLVPRAIDTHRWYRERFPDYPPERRALVPFLL
ncbi:MAG: DUF1295 domain-containing protein [Myxococcota bacterium]